MISNDPNQRIVFAGAAPVSPGKWNGITINSGSSTNISTLRRCNVQYATNGIKINYTGNTNNVTIDKCRISNNSGDGIDVLGNGYSGASVHPIISSNHIHDNSWDGIYISNYAKPHIAGNRIENNDPNGSGIYGNGSASAYVEFNYVRGSGYGIAFEFNSLAEVHRNTVTMIGQGSGVYSSNSSNLIAYGSGNNKGRNKIVANAVDGIYSSSSSPVFGKDIVNEYGNNQIQDNGGFQAVQSGSGQLRAERCYWAGQQNDISGNVDNSPNLTTVPSPVGWGYADTYDPSLIIRRQDDIVVYEMPIMARVANPILAQNGTIISGFDPAAWSAKFLIAMTTGLAKGDWAEAAEVITELWRELQDSLVPTVDYKILADYANSSAVEPSIRKYLALTLVEKNLAEQNVSKAIADLATYGQSNLLHKAELLSNTGMIHLLRNNDLMAAQNILAQLRAMAENGDAAATEQVNLFGKLLQRHQRHPGATSQNNNLDEKSITINSQTDVSSTNLTLAQNYPNPFNPTTIIRFHLRERQKVRLLIFDLNGKLVRTLVEGELPAGAQTMLWDGRDQQGKTVASGVYFYELVAGNKVERKKMTLVR